MKAFFHHWYRRPTAVLSWSLALILWGAWSVAHVPLEWLPQVELPQITINAHWAGANPRAVERYVTAPIERAIQEVPGITSVKSVSQESATFITLTISEETNPATFTAAVNEQLALVRETLPDRVYPVLTKEIPEELRDQQGFMTLQLIGTQPADELRSLADNFLAPKLRLVPGIGQVEVSGGTERELRITLDPAKLAAYQLTPHDVQQALLESISDEVYGRLRMKGRAFLLMSPSEQLFQNLAALPLAPKTLTNTTPHPIPLSEVATLQIQDAPIRSISRIDGQQVVSLQLSRTPGSHLLQTAALVRLALTNFKNKLPRSVRVLVADDRSESVQKELNNLAWQGSIGLLLVVLVLIFMLKSLRMVAMVLFSVFWAFSVSFLLLNPLGLSLNLVTLGGLVLVFGMLADNAVVVVVEWTRLRRPEKPLEETVKEVLDTVWMPLLGGTLTTCVVVLPLIYLSGSLQKLFLPFGVLTALTLLASLVSATLIVPVLGHFLPERQALSKKRPAAKRLRKGSMLPYRFAGAFPRVSLLFLALGLGIPAWLLPDNLNIAINAPPDAPETRLRALYNETIGSDVLLDLRYTLDPYIGGLARIFFQKTTFGQSWKYKESQEVFVSLSFPPGNPIARADSLIQQFEQIALSNKAVKQTIVHASEGSASLNVKFHENTTNPIEPFNVREDLIQQAVLLAGIGVSVSGLIPDGYYNDFRRNINGMRVEAYGANYEDLDSFTNVFAERLKQNPRVAEVDTDSGEFGQEEKRLFLRFQWTPEAQMQTKISAQTLSAALSPIFASSTPIGFADLNGQNRLPIRMLMAHLPETDIARLSEIPLPVSPNKSIALGKSAAFSLETAASSIIRENQQYKRTLAVDFRGPFQLGMDFLDEEIAGMPVPAGYHLQRNQFDFFTKEVSRSFGLALLATVFLVYLTIVFIFESWKAPFYVLTAIPTAFIGVALAFIWTEANFAEGAFIGAVLLTGVAVNNGILLMASYRNMGKAHPTRKPFVLLQLAIRKRLRPMWATTLVAVVGMLPVLVAPETNDFWLGLSATVTGGLLSSTLLIPFVMMAVMGKKGKKVTHFPKQKYIGFIKWNPLRKGKH